MRSAFDLAEFRIAATYESERPMRWLVTLLAVTAIIGFGWVFTLPSKAQCVASGRVVDPTERHCESATGYQQLEEHALFHSREVVLGTLILVAVGYAITRYVRWRSRRRTPAA